MQKKKLINIISLYFYYLLFKSRSIGSCGMLADRPLHQTLLQGQKLLFLWNDICYHVSDHTKGSVKNNRHISIMKTGVK